MSGVGVGGSYSIGDTSMHMTWPWPILSRLWRMCATSRLQPPQQARACGMRYLNG